MQSRAVTPVWTLAGAVTLLTAFADGCNGGPLTVNFRDSSALTEIGRPV